MSALHVVGVDFQLRLRVDRRALGEQQVLVALDGVRLLRLGTDDDAPVEDALALAVEDPFVKFVAVRVRPGVIERSVVVDVLPAACDVEAVQRALGALAIEDHLNLVARQRRPKGDVVRDEGAARALTHRQHAEVQRRFALFLELVVFEHRAIARDDLRDGVGEVAAGAAVGLDDLRLAIAARHDQNAREGDGGRPGGRRHEQQLDRRLEHRGVRDLHQRAVFEHRRVQRHQRV